MKQWEGEGVLIPGEVLILNFDWYKGHLMKGGDNIIKLQWDGPIGSYADLTKHAITKGGGVYVGGG